MALEVTKSVNLSGQSIIDEKTVVYLSASVSTESVGNTNISQTIQDAKNIVRIEHSVVKIFSLSKIKCMK